MTREEKMKGLYSLKEYLVENPIELEGHKSLPITLIDYAIEALEQDPKSEWQKDHEILKAYSDGANEVLDKIRAEIKAKIEEEEFARSVFRHEEKDTAKAEQCTGSIMAYNNVIKFIDKYKGESEE